MSGVDCQVSVENMLRHLRALPVGEYLSHIYTVCGLWSQQACPDLLESGFGSMRPVFHGSDGVICCDEAGILHLPEIHVWIRNWCDVGHLGSRLLRLPHEEWILSVSERQRLVLNHIPDHMSRPLQQYDEALFRYAPRARQGGTAATKADSYRFLSMRDEEQPFLQSGAYPAAAVQFLRHSAADAFTLTDKKGKWASRCYLLPRDFRVLEICGLQTRAECRGMGLATMLLAAVIRKAYCTGIHLIYLTHRNNTVSMRIANKAGLRLVETFSKYRIDARSGGGPSQRG